MEILGLYLKTKTLQSFYHVSVKGGIVEDHRSKLFPVRTFLGDASCYQYVKTESDDVILQFHPTCALSFEYRTLEGMLGLPLSDLASVRGGLCEVETDVCD